MEILAFPHFSRGEFNSEKQISDGLFVQMRFENIFGDFFSSFICFIYDLFHLISLFRDLHFLYNNIDSSKYFGDGPSSRSQRERGEEGEKESLEHIGQGELSLTVHVLLFFLTYSIKVWCGLK